MQSIYSKWAVLYSFEQKCFHIETLGKYCKHNTHSSLIKQKVQFVLICVTDTDLEAGEAVEQLTKKFNW